MRSMPLRPSLDRISVRPPRLRGGDPPSPRWDRTLDSPLEGRVPLYTSAARVMIRRGRGKIINRALSTGVRAEPRRVHYNEGWRDHTDEVYRRELAPSHMNVNVIGPVL